ncbi:hypothetical protein [Corynebacterium sp.]|uniref:hypothetical protein n=1 Tax=Corynebacterium sp. TaxID=1720 RepID=UPI0026DFBFAF|nr:hypothetical protein [Corynebacterium sp.]MDO5512712.1 hypothetical protein [Corynebacterium sp.]
MTKFIRFAVAAATAATVAIAPLSAAHASSFGGSSSGGGAVVEQPTQPAPQPSGIDGEAVAAKLNVKLVEELKRQGHTENAQAAALADEVSREATAGELVFEKLDYGMYQHSDLRFTENGWFTVEVVRLSEDAARLLLNNFDRADFDFDVIAPFGTSVTFDGQYVFISNVFKIS